MHADLRFQNFWPVLQGSNHSRFCFSPVRLLHVVERSLGRVHIDFRGGVNVNDDGHFAG